MADDMDDARADAEKFLSFMEVEYCRFCGRSGIYLGNMAGYGEIEKGPGRPGGAAGMLMQSSANTSLLTTPCSCLRKHLKFAHMPCLIAWIHTNLSNSCADCQESYNCVHRLVPLRDWRLNPSTETMMCQYISSIILAITIGILDGFVIYLVWMTVLPVTLKVFALIILIAMYAAGLVAGSSRLVALYNKLFIFNCPVVDVIPPKTRKSSKVDILALL